jgi:peroxiredoxin Q/BCP
MFSAFFEEIVIHICKNYKMIRLAAGQKAPAFAAKDQNNRTVALKDFIGKKVVLYFYTEDDTTTFTIKA